MPAVGEFGDDFVALEQASDNLQVHVVIVDSQNLRARRREEFFLRAVVVVLKVAFVIFADRIFVNDFLNQLEREFGAVPVFADDFKAAVHHAQKFLNNRDTQARAFNVAIFLLVETLERLKQLVHILRANANARVADFDLQFQGVGVEFPAAHVQRDRARVRVLDGVG